MNNLFHTMKTYLMFLLMFALAMVCSAIDILSYPEACQKAKNEKKPIVVFSDGSNWLPHSREFRESYRNLADQSPLGTQVVWAIKDDKVGLTPEEIQEEKKRPSPPIKIWAYPGIQVVDSEGRGIFRMQNLNVQKIGKADAILQKSVQMIRRRDEFWAKADKLKGPLAAENWAKGLLLLPSYVRGSYKSILERIRKEDPEDKTGYYLRLTFNAAGFIGGQINPLLKEKKYDEAYSLANKYLQLPRLSQEQKQHVAVALWRIAAAEGNKEKSLLYLKRTAQMNPNTTFGQNCMRLYNFYTKPIELTSLRWFDTDIRPDWTLARVKVGHVVKEAGTYIIEFKQLNSRTRFRKLEFQTRGKTLAKVPDDKDRYRFELTLPSNPSSDMTLVFEMRGSEHGAGEIMITKKS